MSGVHTLLFWNVFFVLRSEKVKIRNNVLPEILRIVHLTFKQKVSIKFQPNEYKEFTKTFLNAFGR